MIVPMPQSSSHVRAWSTTAPLHFRQQERTGLVGQLFPYVAHRGAIPQKDQGIDNLPRNLVHKDRTIDQLSGATNHLLHKDSTIDLWSKATSNLVHKDRILDQRSGATSVHQGYRATTWCTKRPPVEQVCKKYRVHIWQQLVQDHSL